MKITYNWLKEYVEFPWSPEELVERLTMLGLEVEGFEKIGGGFEGIVVAEVLEKKQHPDADKLSVCQVADGQGTRQIVCGAKNFVVGDKVPLILPGATLPPTMPDEKPFTIKVGKLRGVESQGMMCSGREIGLSDDHEGLLILDRGSEVGKPLAEHLGMDGEDWLYDLEVTPNRPDLNSAIGIARDIAALAGTKLQLPKIELPSASGRKTADLVEVELQDADLCPRYTARVVTGAKIGPSPNWLRNTLEKVGIRSINNVVDVTNYVMMEFGQPLHAFDYHLLAKSGDRPKIVVRKAAGGEKFTTLDEQERELDAESLVIADTEKAVALAGVMGGLNTEIKDDTTDILIESAYFNPQNIRRTSKKLDLRTDSSYRFERGCDPNICELASQRAAQLIIQTAGGELADGVVDAYPTPIVAKEVSLRFAKTNALLGIEIPAATQVEFLTKLELELVTQDESTASFRAPTFRVDIKREVDLIEEVTRLHGIDKIPSTTPRGAVGANAFDAEHDTIAEARRLLTSLGLDEAQGQTLIANAKAALVSESHIPLSYPLSSDMDVLRPSLLPGLIDSLHHNLSHGNRDVALFEIGRVFTPGENGESENRRLAIALTGHSAPAFWGASGDATMFDIRDLKGLLEVFLESFGVGGLTYQRRPEPTNLFVESAEIRQGPQLFGQLGLLLPTLGKKHDLRDAVLLAELDFDLLLKRRKAARSFSALPAFPAIRRDVAMLVGESVTHDDVLKAVRKAKAPNLQNAEIFDIFRGKGIPDGQKSIAYAFTYRSTDKTLTDKEVDKAHAGLVEKLKSSLSATVR